MSKYRIRIFSSFGDSNNCKEVFEKICETDLMENYGQDKEIYITNDDNYTHVILMNIPMPTITVPKSCVVGLAFEPPSFLVNDNWREFEPPNYIVNHVFKEFMNYAKDNVSKYFVGTSVLPAPFVSHYSYMWHVIPPRIIAEKNQMMSIMVSNKLQSVGHQFRHSLVKEILKTNLNIHIYGRGAKFYNDPRVKGEFKECEPYEKYHFHICIENFQTESYTSEKYTNCVLFGTTPIYWGAKNINSLFPGITIELSGSLETDMQLLHSIMQNPLKYKKHFDQNEIRPKINILKNLDDIFSP